MFKNKLPFGRYDNSIIFRRALALHFKNYPHEIINEIIFFDNDEVHYDFLSDFGMELVVEDNI